MPSNRILTLTLGCLVSCSASPPGASVDSGAGDRDGGSADAPADASLATAPIVAPDDMWTWVNFPDAVCASGTPTGILVNPHAGSTEVMIYLEGGGACTSADTCWGSDPSAKNVAGYDASTFAATEKLPTLFRSPANAFTNMNMVYVPYCTGDMHSGTTLANLTMSDGGSAIPTYFYGATDMAIFLKRIVPTFPGATRIWLTGSSAGGFGTTLNFDRVATAFGVGVDVLDDSGPPIVAKGSPIGDNTDLFGVWGTPLPAGCSPCTGFRDVLDYNFTVQQTFSPPGEFGFMSFLEDKVLSADFHYDLTLEYPQLMQTFSDSLPTNGLAATYLVSNYPAHVVEATAALIPDYMPWLAKMIARDPAWVDTAFDASGLPPP